MGKKNKKKLRKILRQQASGRRPEATGYRPQSTGEEKQIASPSGLLPALPTGQAGGRHGAMTNNVGQATKNPAEQTTVVTEDAKEVKHEIKKILLTMLALFAIIVAVYLINIKTDIILKTGDWATNFLKISV